MALTLVTTCFARVNYTLEDTHKLKSSVSVDFENADDTLASLQAKIIAFGTAVEALSNAKVCQISISYTYDVTGGKANSENATYQDKNDIARFTYSHVGSCRNIATISVPAPKQSIFSGTEKRLVDPSNALVIAFNSALIKAGADTTGLADRVACTTDYEFDKGVRDNRQLPTPNVG